MLIPNEENRDKVMRWLYLFKYQGVEIFLTVLLMLFVFTGIVFTVTGSIFFSIKTLQYTGIIKTTEAKSGSIKRSEAERQSQGLSERERASATKEESSNIAFETFDYGIPPREIYNPFHKTTIPAP